MYKMNQWAGKRINTHSEQQAKSMPCHVTKVDKDFIHVAFETQNGIFTPPTVKIPQSWSQYSREPTQVGDKGYAVPGNYYLGGVTGDSGGNTDFYPRGNLTTLSFNGTSHKQNPTRDYDQLTHMGGPNGWIVGAHQKQQQDQQQQQNGGQSANVAMLRPSTFRLEQERVRKRLGISTRDATTSGTSSSGSSNGSGQQQQDQDQTQFSFDKNKKSTVQSTDSEHSMVVDKQNDHAHLSVTAGGKAYIGGDGQKGQYARIMTEQGPSNNSYARLG
jgi:hypothetical protein